MTTRKTRTVIAVALSLIMALAYMPCAAFAADGDQTQDMVSDAEVPEDGFQEDETIMPESVQDENLSVKNIQLPDSDVLLENYLVQEASREVKASAVAGLGKNTRGKRLTGNNAAVYNYLKEEIIQIADGTKDSSEILIPMSELAGGKECWTAADLGVDNILVNYAVPDDVVPALVAKYRFDIDPVLNALLADLPYDMYWFDKKKGIYAKINDPGGLSLCRDQETGEWAVKWDPENGWMMKLYVSKDYSTSHAASTTDIDVSKTAAAKTAAANAGTIVGNNKSKTDLAKLTAYKDAICNLASYDSDGLNASSPDDNLWQMIYVFDNDSSTNVVCEGYSKAFQFLCDITEFESARIESHLVSGMMTGGTGAGPHMWNVLHMNDNRNYIVDVTNCDTGTIGYPDYLFLKKIKSGSVANGYKYATAGDDISYTYDQDTLNTYDEDELTMSATAYTECNHSWGSGEITKQPDCVNEGIRTYTCSRCGDIHLEILDTTDHNNGQPVRENEVAASCTEDGHYDEVIYCTQCNAELSREMKTISRLGHVPADPVRENEEAATCTKTGGYDEVIYCARCNAELSREAKTIGKLDHIPADPIRENENAASCTAAGSYEEVVYCTKCGNEISRETRTISKLAHTPGEPVQENKVAATCTKDGHYEEVIYCKKCKTELSRENKTIDKLGHTPGEPVRENEVAATCTEDGSCDEVIYCSKCNAELSRSEGILISHTGHHWDTGVVTKMATWKTTGVKTFTCKDCTSVKTSIIPKLTPLAQKVSIKTTKKTVKQKTLKKKAVKVAPLTVKGAKGIVTYRVTGGNAKSKKALKLNNKNGRVTVKKKTKKGKYIIKVKVSAAASANGQYNTFTKTVAVTVVVK